MLISVVIHWIMAAAVVVFVRVLKLPPLAIWGFFIGFIIILGLSIFLRFQSGKWRRLSVIDDETVQTETHRPKVAVESEWL